MNKNTDDTRAKVFVLNDRGWDYRKAETYGNVEPVTLGKLNVFDGRWYYALREHFRKHANEDDCLVLVGYSVVCALGVAAWMELFGKVRLLIWDEKTRDYVLRTYDATENLHLSSEQVAELFNRTTD